jgi:O-antigen ligase
LLIAAVLARATTRRWRIASALTLAVGVAAALMLLWVMPEKFGGFPAGEALRIRAGMGAAALRATATHPLFGIGVGEFYNRSPEFMSREMLAIYPRENAHNNYLQILAELGIVGLAAFLWLLYASLAPRRSDLKAFWTEGKWNGLHVGLLVFLVTCLSGHPLLVPEVAYIFWIALGLAAADRQEAIGNAGSSRRARTVAAVLCAFVLVSLPIRISSARQAKNLQDVVFGVSHWRVDATGVAYRRLATDATFFIPAAGTFVDIPLRVSEPFAEPVSVSISFDDVFANRVVLEGTDWRRVHLLLPHSTDGKWIRVRLIIEPATAPTVLLGTLDQR